MRQYSWHKDTHGIVAHYINVNNIDCKYYGCMCVSGNYCWAKIDGHDVYFNMDTYTQTDFDTFCKEVANEVYKAESEYENYLEYFYS